MGVLFFQSQRVSRQAPPLCQDLPGRITVTCVMKTWRSPLLRSLNTRGSTCILQSDTQQHLWISNLYLFCWKGLINVCGQLCHCLTSCVYFRVLWKWYYFPLVVIGGISSCLLPYIFIECSSPYSALEKGTVHKWHKKEREIESKHSLKYRLRV